MQPERQEVEIETIKDYSPCVGNR